MRERTPRDTDAIDKGGKRKVPRLRQPDVIAILCSDIHLSHRPPIARSAEPDWYKAMDRSLGELRELQQIYDVPVFCAGDIFDHWKAPPELINFALDKLPKMFAVPGQHDLPGHAYEERHKSAFGTLVAAGRVTLLEPGCPFFIASHEKDVPPLGVAWGTPWNGKIKRPDPFGKTVYLAVVHRYVWIPGHNYPSAPNESRIKSLKSELDGYSVAVFGDNHKGFQSRVGSCEVFNCGTFFRRKIDEMAYKPQVGLLKADGTVVSHELDTSADKWIDVDVALGPIESLLDMSHFLAELTSLGDAGLNFVEAVRQYITKNGVDKSVRSVITEALDANR